MKYSLVFTERFKKEVSKLDNSERKLLKGWILKHLVDCENPRAFGKPLIGNKNGYWRYRVGNYRIIVEIYDSEFIILALTYGHRSEVYK